jgi:hypothetical protein
MIRIGSLVLWDGVFTQWFGDPKDKWIGIVSGDPPETTPAGLYYKVIFPHTTQRCLVDELEVIA